jgi:hypothetical protein
VQGEVVDNQVVPVFSFVIETAQLQGNDSRVSVCCTSPLLLIDIGEKRSGHSIGMDTELEDLSLGVVSSQDFTFKLATPSTGATPRHYESQYVSRCFNAFNSTYDVASFVYNGNANVYEVYT